jgi:hypothetical protein
MRRDTAQIVESRLKTYIYLALTIGMIDVKRGQSVVSLCLSVCECVCVCVCLRIGTSLAQNETASLFDSRRSFPSGRRPSDRCPLFRRTLPTSADCASRQPGTTARRRSCPRCREVRRRSVAEAANHIRRSVLPPKRKDTRLVDDRQTTEAKVVPVDEGCRSGGGGGGWVATTTETVG